MTWTNIGMDFSEQEKMEADEERIGRMKFSLAMDKDDWMDRKRWKLEWESCRQP